VSTCTTAAVDSETRKVEHFDDDPFHRPTFQAEGDPTSASHVTTTRLYDSMDNLIALGLPYNNAQLLCGGFDSTAGAPVSAACSALGYDLANRLTRVDPPKTAPTKRTCFGYDDNSNITSIKRGCPESANLPPGEDDCAGCTSNVASYGYDDFGNLISATLPWTGTSGASGVTNYEYDPLGNVVYEQRPGMSSMTSPELLKYSFDSLSRPRTMERIASGVDETIWEKWYDGTMPNDLPNGFSSTCGVPSATNGLGRLTSQDDSFGTTFYGYDASGNMTTEDRVRNGTYATTADCNAPHNRLQSTYTYWNDHRLYLAVYPYGRRIWYTYYGGGAIDRVLGIMEFHFWGDYGFHSLIDNAIWEPYGGLRGYEIQNSTGNALDTIEYTRGGYASPPIGTCPAGGLGAPSIAYDSTGQTSGLWVSPGEVPPGQPTGSTFAQAYYYDSNQLVRTDSCALGTTTPSSYVYAYNADLSLYGALGPAYSGQPGPFGINIMSYDEKGGRTSVTWDSSLHGMTYGLADQLAELQPAGSHRWKWDYHYAPDGTVTSKRSESDSSGLPASAFTFTSGPGNGSGSSGVAITNVMVKGGATYSYYYDSRNRRRAKMNPTGIIDEYFYSSNDELIVDQGNDSSSAPSYQVTDEYVWLGGRPVAVFRGSLGSDWTHQDDSLGMCSRDGDGAACGVYFPVTDPLGKPVLMLDSVGRIAGVGEYDVDGNLNRVRLDDEAHDVEVNGSYHVGSVSQPLISGLREDLRGHVNAFDPVCDKNGGDYASAKMTTPGYLWTWSTCQLDNYWFPWLPSSDGTASFDITSSRSVKIWGEIVDGYEYRRYQPGATPYWIPLRFPGQYHDNETDLNQNWNRFYDPGVGGYTGPEPRLATQPQFVRVMAQKGISVPVYGYAFNNPIAFIDPNGLGPPAGECGPGDSTVSCCLKQHPGEWERCGAEKPQKPNKCGDDPKPQKPDDPLAPHCREAKETCIILCSDTTLPSGDYQGMPFYKCLNKCMRDNGC